MVGWVGVVVVAVIIKVGECNGAITLEGVAADEGTRVVRLIVGSALTGASVGKVHVRHCG